MISIWVWRGWRIGEKWYNWICSCTGTLLVIGGWGRARGGGGGRRSCPDAIPVNSGKCIYVLEGHGVMKCD